MAGLFGDGLARCFFIFVIHLVVNHFCLIEKKIIFVRFFILTSMKCRICKQLIPIAVMVLCCAMPSNGKSKSVPFSYEESSNSNTMEPANGIIMNPLIADLEMIGNEKVTYKETFSVNMDADAKEKIQRYKDIALAHAEKEYKADVMIGVRYEVHASETEIEVTVTGYPAYYKNFRNATKKDRWMLKLYRGQQGVEP